MRKPRIAAVICVIGSGIVLVGWMATIILNMRADLNDSGIAGRHGFKLGDELAFYYFAVTIIGFISAFGVLIYLWKNHKRK